MKTNKFLLVMIAILIAIPMLALPMAAHAATTIPTFKITEVKKDVSVAIETKDFPANVTFIVTMGEYWTKGVKGIEVGTLDSVGGGTIATIFNIPKELQGRAQISIRMEGTGGWYSYNYFVNDPNGVWPEKPTETPAPATPEPTLTPAPSSTPAPSGYKGYPTFTIKSVEPGVSVTITTDNFPKNLDFTVLMGKMWTKGIKGIEIAQFNSKDGGAFEATFNVPSELKEEKQVAIRVQSKEGYYAYNWFANAAAAPAPTATPAPETPPSTPPTPAPAAKNPSFSIEAVVAGTSVTVKGSNLPANTDFVVKMGKMWTKAIGGIEAAKFNSGAGGDFEATYPIPADLAKLPILSIRMDGTGGWYAYNWFWNVSTAE